LIILFGGLLSVTTGFRYNIEVNEKETVVLPHTDLKLTLDKFWIDHYKNTETPKSYNSSVAIIKDGEAKLKKTIRVNGPLSYQGIRIYQMSYGTRELASGLTFVLILPDGSMERFNTGISDLFAIKNTPYRIKIAEFMPDSVNPSLAPPLGNPFVVLEVYENNSLLQKKKFRWGELLDLIHKGDKYSVFFHSPVFQVYSGLEVVRDTSARIAGIGSLILILGVILTLVFSEEQLSVQLDDRKINIDRKLGFISDKKFEQLLKEIK